MFTPTICQNPEAITFFLQSNYFQLHSRQGGHTSGFTWTSPEIGPPNWESGQGSPWPEIEAGCVCSVLLAAAPAEARLGAWQWRLDCQVMKILSRKPITFRLWSSWSGWAPLRMTENTKNILLPVSPWNHVYNASQGRGRPREVLMALKSHFRLISRRGTWSGWTQSMVSWNCRYGICGYKASQKRSTTLKVLLCSVSWGNSNMIHGNGADSF